VKRRGAQKDALRNRHAAGAAQFRVHVRDPEITEIDECGLTEIEMDSIISRAVHDRPISQKQRPVGAVAPNDNAPSIRWQSSQDAQSEIDPYIATPRHSRLLDGSVCQEIDIEAGENPDVPELRQLVGPFNEKRHAVVSGRWLAKAAAGDSHISTREIETAAETIIPDPVGGGGTLEES
jgi:hypothetical protein